jgi:hypothetical protein
MVLKEVTNGKKVGRRRPSDQAFGRPYFVVGSSFVQYFVLSNDDRHVIILDMRPIENTETSVFERAAKAVLDTTGLACELTVERTSARKDGEVDGVAGLRFRQKQVRQPCVVKRLLNSTTLHLLILLKRESPEGLLLVTTHVNDRQAGALRKAGIHFMDASGNVFLDTPELYLCVCGRRAARPATASNGMRAFHPSGLQLLFALLVDPCLDSETPGSALVDRTYREISAATGISRSTIGWVMADLIRQGFVVDRGGGFRRLSERKRILERWVQSYADRLRPGLVIGRYRPAKGDWWKTARLEGGLWSGEVAAALLTGDLKPGTATIFGAIPSHAFVLDHDMQKDPQGTVEFLKPFWQDSVMPTASNNCVHPLLVYADLMSIDDERTHEVAQSIYDRYLRSIIEAA